MNKSKIHNLILRVVMVLATAAIVGMNAKPAAAMAICYYYDYYDSGYELASHPNMIAHVYGKECDDGSGNFIYTWADGSSEITSW